ncbi:50S ribosomal protein L6 [Candidatus Pacearchaeota archaeon]|nr:50S ribosomal protein L6 [Candidatus Pacearchaeota archaeon]
MKKKLQQSIQIPEGVSCKCENKILTCRKDSTELKRKVDLPQIEIKIEGKQISLTCKKGNKNDYKIIKAFTAHIANMFRGLEKKFVYHLESVNVHFPMTLKAEKGTLAISNFLGEKVPRYAKILSNVEVEIKGQSITISSHDREAAGQTAANFEKATKIRRKDRRIYQDGIYIVEKPARRENV